MIRYYLNHFWGMVDDSDGEWVEFKVAKAALALKDEEIAALVHDNGRLLEANTKAITDNERLEQHNKKLSAGLETLLLSHHQLVLALLESQRRRP